MKRFPTATLAGCLVALTLARAESAPPEPASLERFVGTWTSAEDGTADPVITRLTVEARGSEVTVHVWARCAPSECDWGSVAAERYRHRGRPGRRAGALSAVFPFDGGENIVVLFSGPTDRIYAQVLTRFKDDPSRNVSSHEPLRREGIGLAGGNGGPPRGPLRIGGRIKEPTKVKDVRPVYPRSAKRDRVQGLVVLECTVDPQGKVSNIDVRRGPAELIDAAVEAVEQWEFTPTVVDGVAVPIVMTVTVNFRLG